MATVEVLEGKRLREPEADNARLKKLLVEAELDKAVLKDVAGKMVVPAARKCSVV